MAIKLYKPTTPARRKASAVNTRHLETDPPKGLTTSLVRSAGRGKGGITVRRRGGGAKRLYRLVDFNQTKEVPAVVERLEYDPYRTAWLALLRYSDGERRFILAEASMKPGQAVAVGSKSPIKHGNRVPLERVPGGSTVYNVQLNPQSPATLVRAAGSSAQVLAQEGGFTQLKLPSGEVRRIASTSLASLGSVSNHDHENERIGSAGRNRHRNKRPSVRGKAMNPVDHPHGGGEGGSPIGLKGPKTPSGLYTLGRKTRRRKKPSPGVVRRRP